MMKMTLRQVMASVDGPAAHGAAMDEGTEVTSAVTDSRLAQPGSLFVAITGPSRPLSLAIAMVLAAGIRKSSIRSALRVSRELN